MNMNDGSPGLVAAMGFFGDFRRRARNARTLTILLHSTVDRCHDHNFFPGMEKPMRFRRGELLARPIAAPQFTSRSEGHLSVDVRTWAKLGAVSGFLVFS